jgi:hypothetical protein
MPSDLVTAILKTTDVAGTLDWYRRMGFEVRGVFPDEGEPTWCEVARNGVVLQFLGGETPWPGPPAFTGPSTSTPRALTHCSNRSRSTRRLLGVPKIEIGGLGNSGSRIPTATSSRSRSLRGLGVRRRILSRRQGDVLWTSHLLRGSKQPTRRSWSTETSMPSVSSSHRTMSPTSTEQEMTGGHGAIPRVAPRYVVIARFA